MLSYFFGPLKPGGSSYKKTLSFQIKLRMANLARTIVTFGEVATRSSISPGNADVKERQVIAVGFQCCRYCQDKPPSDRYLLQRSSALEADLRCADFTNTGTERDARDVSGQPYIVITPAFD